MLISTIKGNPNLLEYIRINPFKLKRILEYIRVYSIPVTTIMLLSFSRPIPELLVFISLIISLIAYNSLFNSFQTPREENMPVNVQEDKVILGHPLGSSAEVYFYGATITSWKYRGKELLFLSKKSILNGTKAIRGGIPLVFPQFARASDPSAETAGLPQHGFARISKFKWAGILVDNKSEVSVRFELNDSHISENVRKDWPKKFKLFFTVTLSDDTLKTNLSVKNEDDKPFDFQALLHTYYSVPDISKVSIEGLYNISYIDKVNNLATSVENDQSVKITQSTDRIYKDVPTKTIKININDNSNEAFILQRTNLKDTVVWNPWMEGAKHISDFDDDGYKQMVCVEPGNVSNYITLKSGESWEGGQIIQYKP